jgi:hypothetical protein
MARVFARFGTLASVPRIVVSPAKLLAMPLDPRAGFVLSRIDGRANVEAIIDSTGLPSEKVLATLVDLVTLQVIALA